MAQTDTKGGEKRAYERYFICLGASVKSDRPGVRDVTVKDFCIGGMSLSFDLESDTANTPLYSPTLHETVNIRCTVTVAKKNKDLTFRGCVLRIEQAGFTIKFLNPDLNSLQILQGYAKATRISKKNEGSEPSVNCNSNEAIYKDKTAKQLLLDCNEMAKEILTPIIVKFQEEIVEELFDASKNTRNMIDLNAHYDAIKIIKEKKNELRDIFCSSAISQIENFSPYTTNDNQKNENDVFDAESLSLVGDDDFDDWLADTTTIDSVESRNRNTLVEIEKRLSVLYDCEIKKKNNPYGPALFTKAFQEATYSLDLNHAINMALYKVFKEVLLSLLFNFYLTLNKLLKDNGVLTVMQYKFDKPKHNNPDKRQRPDEQLDTVVADESATEITLSESTSSNSSRSSKSKKGAQNIYQLIGELRNLQRDLSEKTDRQNVSGNIRSELAVRSEPDNKYQDQSTATYTPDEILNALSKLNTATTQLVDYKSAVIAALKNSKNGEEVKNVGAREHYIIDVAGDIFHSMTADMQVSEKVHRWIQQLELPVLKMALIDDTVFINRSHVVRQVINKIAQLEILVGEVEKANQPMIGRVIDWIIKLITEEFNGSIEVFTRAVYQLDILLKSQNDIYVKNINQVINELRSQEQEIALNNTVDEVKQKITVEWAASVDKEERKAWVKKALRIGEGDWLVFCPKSNNPVRLRVAWFAPNTSRFVLVDLSGMKNRILHSEELAEQLRNGAVSVLENADEPAMDRAQYSVFQDLHTKLIYQATHDQVTGLISRRNFQKKIDNSIAESKHNKQQHVICFIKLDQFSVINNACGYDGGDKLLKDVADLLVKGVGEHGIVACITGDEFAILLNDCTLDDGLDIIEEQLDALSEYRLLWEDKKLSITCSAGVVSISRRNTKDAGTLIQQAESSCRVAKDMGSNRIQIYHAEHEKLSHRNIVMKWAAEIDQILDEETLYLKCQQIMPIGDPDSGKHYEILLGVCNLKGEEIATPDFIEAAERYNRMQDVDRWVLRNAFRWIAENHEKAVGIDVFSINLSGLSLNDESFLDFVIEEMKITKVPTEKICYEITETAGVSNLSNASEFIKKLKETGCMFSLDDFGTGMSSYAYLKNMPVDYLKIDGAFITEIVNNPYDYALVKSICEIGQYMGKKIVAECVINDQILKQLENIGVDYAQGHGIEEPRILKDLLS